MVNVEDDRMKSDISGPLVVNPPAIREPKSPFSGGLKGIAGVLSRPMEYCLRQCVVNTFHRVDIFDEESRHFYVQKSAKFKRIGYTC